MKTIVQEGDPVLRAIAEPVPEHLFGSPELASLLADMTEALDREPEGVALAAPQVGVSYRLFIVRVDRSRPLPEETDAPILSDAASVPEPEVEVYINPEIIKSSRKRSRADEGCLSIRGIYGVTTPHERMTVTARRADGSHFTRGAGGLLAQIFEHEINHLNGILFIDHADHLIEIKKDSDA